MNKVQQKWYSEGYCDERGAAFAAMATKLNNSFCRSIVALCVKGNTLYIYDVDMKNNILDLLFSVKLKDIKNLKIRCSIFSQVLKFEYDGAVFSFTNFLGVKPALNVIKEENQKQ